ncbi:uncharacterized protein LOC106872101 isoform X3 [Octopus bimaculoides]|uniref:uncharacterized protein LOC106872101 isoform X3 n=1 Tax=Octopus bimaculoides TaxID=37653 RepID=UPI0022E3A5C4|nr:uncharacterized protein LOC106872101 isoform X3 [Octopus bimaculoides]
MLGSFIMVIDATLQVQTESFQTDTMVGCENMENNTTTSGFPKLKTNKPKASSMETPAVRDILSMGDKWNFVKRIMKKKIKETTFHKPKVSYMETPTVLAVLSMGYKRNLVKRIVKNKIKETGSSFSQASDLLDKIQNDSHVDDDGIEKISNEEKPDQTTKRRH